MKYCTQCGEKNIGTARFCTSCGTQFEVPAAAEAIIRLDPSPPQQPQASDASPQKPHASEATSSKPRAEIVGRISPDPDVAATTNAMRFAYTAFTKTGEKVSGTVAATDKAGAIRAVERLGRVPVSVTPEDKGEASSTVPLGAPKSSGGNRYLGGSQGSSQEGAGGRAAPLQSASPLYPAGTCPLCGDVTHMNKAKSLYGHSVCHKCYVGFANRRQLAFGIDNTLGLIPWMLPLLPVIFGISLVMLALGASEQTMDSAMNMLLWLLLAPLACCKDCFSGHSLGKYICGVRVIDETTGKPGGLAASFKRNLPLVIPVIPLVVAFQLRSGHRTGDGWSNTKVIWKKYADHPIFAAGGT